MRSRPVELAQYKEAQRQLWADGDYRPVGRLLEPAARTLVDAAGVTAGQRVLDVATGSGSVALLAAAAGAEVLAVDIIDAWFEEARRRADEAEVPVAFVLGDAENLPVDDASFDVVLSSFGAIFAPRHDLVAAELVRACRPGGTIAFTAWASGGANDAMFSALTADLPPPPAFASRSTLWGDPDHVRNLFAPSDLALRFERPSLPVAFASVEAFEAFVFENSGGFIAARRILQELGRWEETSAALRRALEESNEAQDGTYRVSWDYVLVLGTKAT